VFRFSRGTVMLASFFSGFITMTVGVVFVYPNSFLYSPEGVWIGCLAIIYGLSIMAGNFYYIRKDRSG